ncbi:type II toxin-antitoxin system VapC family toxin [Candidatus Nitrospira allomarina]|uniref:Type II toxin-antitoxin system VapC family toxin n=1 Tax=Candidatus Nitrospira allomarina TaxID=3020900 RepID=A0AA96GAL0_9BACT|nr:type II toxin-antitoxin system VapC family toxin [Candidatus Nitrospira allomarina]WNM57502.1 type II toxin-antitoxin system VapC family toxin [Candidatus Nitrospira allomarina]
MPFVLDSSVALAWVLDATSTERALEETMTLARKYELTTYDASYLELAKRRGTPLATFDTKLRQACVLAKIPVLPS